MITILPVKNYTPLSTLNQLCLPMDVGVLGRSYAKIVADAGYESEENYAYLEEHQQEAYIKLGVRCGKGVRRQKRTGRWEYQKSCLPFGKPHGRTSPARRGLCCG
jgi:hypothetical protein